MQIVHLLKRRRLRTRITETITAVEAQVVAVVAAAAGGSKVATPVAEDAAVAVGAVAVVVAQSLVRVRTKLVNSNSFVCCCSIHFLAF